MRMPEIPIAYVVEWGAGDYSLYRVRDILKAKDRLGNARVYGLFNSQQEGCDQRPFAYHNECRWFQAKYAPPKEDLGQYEPMYPGLAVELDGGL